MAKTNSLIEEWIITFRVSPVAGNEILAGGDHSPLAGDTGYKVELCLGIEIGSEGRARCELRLQRLNPENTESPVWAGMCYTETADVGCIITRGTDAYGHPQFLAKTEDNLIDLRLIDYAGAGASEYHGFLRSAWGNWRVESVFREVLNTAPKSARISRVSREVESLLEV